MLHSSPGSWTTKLAKPSASWRTGVKEDERRCVCYKPSSRIIAAWHTCNGHTKTPQDRRQAQQAAFLQGPHPFGVVDERCIYASVSFGGARDALVGRIDMACAIPRIAHGAILDGMSVLIYDGMIHVQGRKDLFTYKGGK